MITGTEREPGDYWRDTAVRGEWETEPHDWGTWVDDETGLVCLIRRNHSGGFRRLYIADFTRHLLQGLLAVVQFINDLIELFLHLLEAGLGHFDTGRCLILRIEE